MHVVHVAWSSTALWRLGPFWSLVAIGMSTVVVILEMAREGIGARGRGRTKGARGAYQAPPKPRYYGKTGLGLMMIGHHSNKTRTRSIESDEMRSETGESRIRCLGHWVYFADDRFAEEVRQYCVLVPRMYD